MTRPSPERPSPALLELAAVRLGGVALFIVLALLIAGLQWAGPIAHQVRPPGPGQKNARPFEGRTAGRGRRREGLPACPPTTRGVSPAAPEKHRPYGTAGMCDRKLLHQM